MFRSFVLALFVGLAVAVGGTAVYGQDAAVLAGALDKNKYKKKEKSKNGVNVSIEIYIDIKNEPVVKQPGEYSGQYRDDSGDFSLDLSVAADGSAEGSGVDTMNGDASANKMAFTLKNARVRGAVLTGDKMFADGTSEKLEAVFVNRTVLSGKNADNIETRETKFGLGFIQRNAKWTNRVFLAAR